MDYNELIAKYVTNDTTAEENALLLEWVISNEANKKEFIEYCQTWYASNSVYNTFNSDKAYQKFLHTKQSTQKTVSIWKTYKAAVAVAAVAILTVGLFFVFKSSSPQIITLANTTASIKTVVLSDGSQIVLQKGASISYPESFKNNARDISLQGTAFCSITRNENAPFTIKTGTISVQVLGTSFEVKSTPKQSHVIVESGKVLVAQNNTSNNSIIVKGQRIDLNSNGFKTSYNNDINFLSWKTGILYFNKTDLQQVFSDIERHYNCSFKVNSSEILHKTITGTYQDLTLSEIITLINSAFPELEFITQSNNQIEVNLTK